MVTYQTRDAAESYLRQHGYIPSGLVPRLWVYRNGTLDVVAEVQEAPEGFVIVAEART